MAWGLPLAPFPLVHVAPSLIAIVSALHALAPHQTEPPFLLVQVVILAVFVILTVVATKRSNRNRSDRTERAL